MTLKTLPQLRRELDDLHKLAASRDTQEAMKNISAMDLLIVSRLRAIKYQEAKDAGLQDH